MEKSIRVQIMGREYALRVRTEDEKETYELADYLDRRLRTFRHNHPEQSELTAAVITALALAEELRGIEAVHEHTLDAVETDLVALEQRLAEALSFRFEEEAEGAETSEAAAREEMQE